jgi:hypothetical protein
LKGGLIIEKGRDSYGQSFGGKREIGGEYIAPMEVVSVDDSPSPVDSTKNEDNLASSTPVALLSSFHEDIVLPEDVEVSSDSEQEVFVVDSEEEVFVIDENVYGSYYSEDEDESENVEIEDDAGIISPSESFEGEKGGKRL